MRTPGILSCALALAVAAHAAEIEKLTQEKDQLLREQVAELRAEAFVMLTDVDAVYSDWATAAARAMRRASPEQER